MMMNRALWGHKYFLCEPSPAIDFGSFDLLQKLVGSQKWASRALLSETIDLEM